MKNIPAFQFYPSDFLSDENVALMNNAEVGCYIKLLCYCWKQGSIPNDVNKIARLCNETEESMAQLWIAISCCFKDGVNEGRLTHQRLEKERQKQLKFSKERSESGRKGAEIRWKNSTAIAKPIAKPMAKDGSSSSSSINKYSVSFLEFYSSYPLKKEKKKAYKRWQTLKKQNQLPPIDTLLSAITKQKIWRKNTNGEFRPDWKHPATWLNAGCWEDETESGKTKKILTGDEALHYEG